MKKNFLFLIIFTLALASFFILFSPISVFAAYPKLVSKLINGFETIKAWIIKISTPAAAVAVRYRYFYEKV